MKKIISLLCVALVAFGGHLTADDETCYNYPNGCGSCGPPCGQSCPPPCPAPCKPCPPCDPCAPCAPVCGTDCGVSICAIAVAVAAIVAAAAIILSSGDGAQEHGH